jgi:hypothetical protein
MKIVRENINEGRLTDVKPTDIINKDLEELFFGDYYTMTVKLAEYCQENYIECDFEDEEQIAEIKDSADFKNYVKYDLEYKFDETVHNLASHITDGKVSMWRVILVKPEWIQHLSQYGGRLGIYWSFEKNAAEPHWGEYGKNEVIFEALINENEIDWKTTIELNVNPTYSDEKEIRLFENTELNIISIKFNDEYIDMSKFKNKKYFA